MLERCPLKLDCSNMTHDSHAVIYGILLTSLWGTTASHLAFTHRISLLVHWKVLMSCTKSIPTLGTAPFTSRDPREVCAFTSLRKLTGKRISNVYGGFDARDISLGEEYIMLIEYKAFPFL